MPEPSFSRRAAVKESKKAVSWKENPTDTKELLAEICGMNGGFTQRNAATPLTEYTKN